MRILVIEDDPSVRYFLTQVAQRDNHEVIAASDGDTAMSLFHERDPHLVFCDLHLPGIGGLEVLRRIRAESRDVYVIMMTGFGSEEVARAALELKADNYLQKPLDITELRKLLAKYNSQLQLRARRDAALGFVQQLDIRLEIPNQLTHVSGVVELFVDLTRPWLPASDRFGIQVGLHELIVNAIEHGNLEITHEEKDALLAESHDAYMALVHKRQGDPAHAGRRVRVSLTLDHDQATLVWHILDDGKGFDYKTLPDPMSYEPDQLLSGRGIFLARLHFDAVEYVGRGNEVIASKRIAPREDNTVK